VLIDVWIDFLCPWAYLGQDRSALLASMGYRVRSRPFELHPEIPPGGRAVAPRGRLAAVYERIGRECEAVGLPFRPPRRVANTRTALDWSEAVALGEPASHDAVVAALMKAAFVDGLDLDDPEVVGTVCATAGIDLSTVQTELESGAATASVDRSMAEARDIGVIATPAWRFESGFVLPGVQPREQVERWARRLAERARPPRIEG